MKRTALLQDVWPYSDMGLADNNLGLLYLLWRVESDAMVSKVLLWYIKEAAL